jgi:hypothetical protein
MGFVTVDALFSVLLGIGIGSPGAERLVEGGSAERYGR